MRERQGIERQLGKRLLKARIRLVVQHMQAPVAQLKDVGMPGDGAGRDAGGKQTDAVAAFTRQAPCAARRQGF